MQIYVRELSAKVTEEDLRQAFSKYGEVTAVSLQPGKARGKTKVTASVEMPDELEAQAAVQRLRGRNLKGKPLKISPTSCLESREKQGSRRSAADKSGGAHGGGSRR